jgi:hypothetical protein
MYIKSILKSRFYPCILYLSGCFVLLAPMALSGQNNLVPFNFTLNQSSTTSAGIFRKDSTLVRTLWNNVKYAAGTHTAYWDRKDDNGRMVTDTSFVVRVLSNNTTYAWEGARIGNTSDSLTGPTKHRYFQRIKSMAITGNTAYYSVGYSEGTTSVYRLNLSTPQNKTGIINDFRPTSRPTFLLPMAITFTGLVTTPSTLPCAGYMPPPWPATKK